MVVELVGRIEGLVGNGPLAVVAVVGSVVVEMGRRTVVVVAARQLVSVVDASLVLARSVLVVVVAPVVATGLEPELVELGPAEPEPPSDVVARRLELSVVEHRPVEPPTDDVAPLHIWLSRPIVDGRIPLASVVVAVGRRPSSSVAVDSKQLEVFSFSSFSSPSFVACTYALPSFAGIVDEPPSYGIARSHLDEVGGPC